MGILRPSYYGRNLLFPGNDVGVTGHGKKQGSLTKGWDALSADDNPAKIISVPTDNDGGYKIGAVPPGAYSLLASNTEPEPAADNLKAMQSWRSQAKPILIGDNELKSLDLHVSDDDPVHSR